MASLLDQFLASYQNHQKVHGFSKRLILERDSGVAIGDSGLFVLPEYGWVDLGFRFAQPYWGKGLATEVASAWVGAAFDEFRVGRLGAFVHPENVLRFEFWKNWGFTPNGGTQSWAWTQSYSLSTRMLVKDCAREGHRKIGAALHLDAGVSG